MKNLKKSPRVLAHGLTWLYYKTVYGDYRYITPKTGKDMGPFKKLKHMRDHIKAFGGNINWQ